MLQRIINVMLDNITDEQLEKIADDLLLIEKRGLDEILQD